jgi:putative glutamine amidotransferase
MKKIAITQRIDNYTSYYEPREMLDLNWARLFEKVGILPIVLPYEYDFTKYFDNIKIDGILLSGGNDLSSQIECALSIKRDKFEKELIKYAIDKSIPLLGVCRGMQVIAEYFDSSLKKVDSQVNIRHTLIPNKSSKYYQYLNKLSTVNSFHNFAVDEISDEILIGATDPSGIIKSIEHKKYKIFAHMWHPEREKDFNINEIELIKYFYGV